MNILATQVPALVWPFPQNREQRLRATRLAGLGWMQILEQRDLKPERMATLIEDRLQRPPQPVKPVNLNGAAGTAEWLESHFG
jgi:predicted glycosyltransferase